MAQLVFYNLFFFIMQFFTSLRFSGFIIFLHSEKSLFEALPLTIFMVRQTVHWIF